MKEYFYISIGKHKSWITGAGHIKTNDINIVKKEHYLKEPSNLKELIINILLIRIQFYKIYLLYKFLFFHLIYYFLLKT